MVKGLGHSSTGTWKFAKGLSQLACRACWLGALSGHASQSFRVSVFWMFQSLHGLVYHEGKLLRA